LLSFISAEVHCTNAHDTCMRSFLDLTKSGQIAGDELEQQSPTWPERDTHEKC